MEKKTLGEATLTVNLDAEQFKHELIKLEDYVKQWAERVAIEITAAMKPQRKKRKKETK